MNKYLFKYLDTIFSNFHFYNWDKIGKILLLENIHMSYYYSNYIITQNNYLMEILQSFTEPSRLNIIIYDINKQHLYNETLLYYEFISMNGYNYKKFINNIKSTINIL